MAKHRSPNYPAHGLSEAVELARQIYAKEKKTQAPGEIIAKALGYSSLSGNARVKIATLKKFGLLEGDESKGMRLSDLAMLILYPIDSAQEADAKRIAALSPTLFRSLYEEKREGSDEAIVNYLVSKLDFSPVGAKQAVDAFRDTLSFAGLTDNGYNASKTPDKAEAQTVQTETKSASTLESVQRVVGAPHSWSWPLSVPRAVNAQLMVTGQFNKTDLLRLAKQIEFIAESFDEKSE
jgi:hypothetical protein